MEKHGPTSRDDNVDTSFMQRRQEALTQEGKSLSEYIDSRVAGTEANDIIIEGLRRLNTQEPHTSEPILDIALDRIAQLRTDGQSEEIVREALNNFISHHPALLKYFTHPDFGITDLPEHNDQTYNRYNF